MDIPLKWFFLSNFSLYRTSYLGNWLHEYEANFLHRGSLSFYIWLCSCPLHLRFLFD